MNVLVVGATGALGRHVLPRLVERGHTVRAVVRDPARAAGLAALGVELFRGDILVRDSLLEPAKGCDAALHLATAIPRPGTTGDWSRNDRIRREGTANLLAAVQAGGVRRYVQQSIIFLYGDSGEAWLEEERPLRPYPQIQSAYEMEQQVAACGLEWCVLRGGWFYGPGTGMEEFWRAALRQGSLRLPGDGQAFTSLIHVVDMARAVVAAAESAAGGSLLNVVDDEPVRYERLYGHVAAQAQLPAPPLGGPASPSLRCSNRRLKEQLGWAPAYPSYRSGLA